MVHRLFSLLCGMLFWATVSYAATASSVTQYGITWTFDHAYTVGQFANSDWWVVGPVTITSITPAYRVRDYWDFTASQAKGVVFKKINGWQVNPTFQAKQSFDETFYEFDSTAVPSLPYLAQPGQSLVKAVSDTNPAHTGTVNFSPADSRMTGTCALLTAGVLTVVNAVPPDSGTTVFRPPYVGTSKPYYSTANLRTDLLPSLASVNAAPTLTWVEESFRRVQLCHKACPYGNMLRPQLNMASTYMPYNAIRNNEGALRLLLNDPLANKRFALIVYVQYGIDVHYIAQQGGSSWPGSGYGVEPGHKLPLAFAAVLLDDQAMKTAAGNLSLLAGNNENNDIALTVNRTALWGGNDSYRWAFADQEQSYWNYIINPPTYNGSNATDPYGYIDNSMTRYNLCDGYQICCLSQPFKGEALTALLVPGMQAVWNKPEFFQYLDRWVNHGLLAQPDPCAPAEGTWSGGASNGLRCTAAQDLPGDTPQCIVDAAKYKVTFGPDPAHPGDCIRDIDPSDGIGRFPNRDAQSPDGGSSNTFTSSGYRSAFVDYMWAAYRATVPLDPPAISPNGGTYSGVVDVILVPAVSTYGTTIRYTTNGSDPTAASAAYSSPVRLTASATLKAKAFFGSYAPSAAAAASFTITADAQAPTLTSVTTRKDSTKVTIVFSELVDSVTARLATNYAINKSINVVSAAMTGNGPTVVLTTSAMKADTVYTLTVNNVKDLSNNTIAAGTQKQFTFVNFDPAIGLTGFWPFDTDQGNTAVDKSGISYNGAVVGAAWTPQGRIGQGLKFAAATDSVTFKQENSGSHFGIENTNAFTFAFWMKVLGHSGSIDNILSRQAVPFAVQVTSTHRITTTLRTSSVDNTLGSTTVLTDSVWYHVALTYQLSTGARNLYINGVRDAGGSNTVTASLYFANMYSTWFGGGFRGILDEVRIYNQALTAGNIAVLYTDTTSSSTAIRDAVRRSAVGQGRLVLPNPVYRLADLRVNPSLYKIYDLSGRPVAVGAVHKSGVYLLETVGRPQVQKVVLLAK